ncbi:MAG: AMP-binding protein [Magnetococcales bacterium]|nr:AMP-binding protein [Magnetococcales bacterium]
MWHDFIRQFAQERPNHLAIIDRNTERQYRYIDLDQEIQHWVYRLFAWGVRRGERVVLVAASRLEHVTLFFACARLGAILVAVNHRTPVYELTAILEPLQAICLLGVGDGPLAQRAGYHDLAALPAEIPPVEPILPVVEDHDVLLILYTSGSTGLPKGVLFHAAMLMANMHYTVAADVLRCEDISIVNTPFFHTGGYNVFCLPMLSIGGTLILHPKFDAGAVLREIREAGVTVFWAVPTMFQMIFDHPDFARTDFSRIRFFLSGGAPLSLNLIQGYHARGVPFKQGFGLTEVGPNCFLLETQDAFRHPDSIGKPMAHSQVKVVDEAGQPVGVDQVGELWITGPHRCQGYWQQQGLFEQSIRDGYFCTGDLVRVDAEGFFYVLGRKKEMYISGGENVFPGEVEKQLHQHADLAQAVVVSVADPKWGEVGLAFYVGARELTLEEVRAFLEPRLSRYKHPHYLVRLAEMPLLANGKVDRPALKGMAGALSLGNLYHA